MCLTCERPHCASNPERAAYLDNAIELTNLKYTYPSFKGLWYIIVPLRFVCAKLDFD